MIFNSNEFWDDNYYNHPPLTDEMVEFCEKELGLKLPEPLINLLKIQNGGYTKSFIFPTNERTSWAENHVSFSELFGIVTDKSIQTPQNILLTKYLTEEWSLPEKQVLLCGDGHW